MKKCFFKKTTAVLLSVGLLFSETAYAAEPLMWETEGEDGKTYYLMTGLSGGRIPDVFYIDEPEYNVPRKLLLKSVFGANESLSDRWGYGDLAKRSSASAREALYEQIYDFALDFTSNGANAVSQNLGGKSYYVASSVDYASLGLSREEALETWVSFRNDNPEFYWISDTAALSDYVIYIIVPESLANGADRNAMNDIISSKLEEYKALADQYTTDFEKCLAVHDKLAKETSYAFGANGEPSTDDAAHSIAGVFADGKAVCEGYAKAYSLILSALGTENIYVSGYAVSKDAKTGKETSVLHSWNLVKLDDAKWHWVDATWDSTLVEGEPTHYYYSQGSSLFLSTHMPFTPSGAGTSFLYELPEAADINITPTELWINGEKKGTYPTLSDAVLAAEGKNAVVKPLRYSNTGLISGKINCEALTIEGNYYDLSATEGEGKFSTDRIQIEDGTEFAADVTFKNLSIENRNKGGKVKITGNRTVEFAGNFIKFAADTDASDAMVIFNSANAYVSGSLKAKEVKINTSGLTVTGEVSAKEIKLSDEIKAVSQTFFDGIRSEKSISFGKETNFISSSAFISQTMLEEINVADGNGTYMSEDGILYRLDEDSKLFMISAYPSAKQGDTLRISLPVRTAEDNSFAGNENLKTVILDYGFSSIGKGTFSNAKKLEKIYIPSTVTMIGKDAFKDSPNVVIYCPKDSEAHRYAAENGIKYELTDEWTYIFLAEDGETVLKSVTTFAGEEILPPEAPEKPDTDHSVFVFKGWNGFENGMKLEGDVEFVPVFEEVMNKYTYVFRNADGTVFASGELAYGDVLTLPENTPEKAMTEKYYYEFTGWEDFEGESITITGDVEFEPVFAEHDRIYTVSFTDDTGTKIISSEEYKFGDSISVPEAPAKESTDTERFTFAGWSGYEENMTVTGDMTFKARFTSEPNVYTYRFIYNDINGEKKTVKEESIYFNTEITAPELPGDMTADGKVYVALGWKNFEEGMLITGDVEFEAEFEAFDSPCRIVFENWDGSVIRSEVVEKGSVILPPGTPSREGNAQYSYSFDGFEGFEEGMLAETDIVFRADYKELVNEYTIRFVDGEHIISEERLPYGTVISAPEYDKEENVQYIYEVEGFEGFEDGMTVCGDEEFSARVTAIVREYTYIFYMDDGETVIKTDTVPYGTLIEAPEAAKQGDEQYYYVHTGYEGFEDGYEISGDCSFRAVFEKKTMEYEIVFYDEDGKTEIKREKLPFGEEIKPFTPDKQATAEFSFEFLGFEGFEDGMTVSGDMTFTAVYKRNVNEYSIVFKDDNGKVLNNVKMAYGTEITAPKSPTKKNTAQYSYSFDHFEGYKSGMKVTGNAEFTAVYQATVNKYTYEFLDDTGEVSLKKVTADYGTVITPPAYSKASDGRYTYTLSEWTGFSNGMKLTGDATFEAVFTAKPNRYTYAFRTEKGDIISQITADYGSTIVPPEAPEIKGYTFVGYKGYEEGMILTKNISFAAEYELGESDFITDYEKTKVNGKDVLKNIAPGTTVDSFMEHFDNGLKTELLDSFGNPVTDGNTFVGTGMTVVLYDRSGNIVASRMTGVPGDVNGDGLVSLTDLILAQNAFMSKAKLTDHELLALDNDNDGVPELSQLIRIRDKVFNEDLRG